MAVQDKDILWCGSANMQEDDASTPQGGAIDLAKKVTWAEISAVQVEAVSSASGDTTQTVTVTGRNAAGELKSETITLTGQTPVQAASPITWDRMLKAVKSATCAGTIAVMSVTNERANTAQSAGADYLILDAGASAVDDAYKDMVLRIPTATAGAGQIQEIVKYEGATKKAYVRNWGTTPTGTITFEVAKGMVFDKITSPAVEIMQVRRPFYNVAADPAGGSEQVFYEKIHIKNLHQTLALTSALVQEVAEGVSAFVDFALESSLAGSDTCTNRKTAPGGYTFNSSDKNVVNSGNLTNNSSQGLWMKFSLPAGTAAQNSYWKPRLRGQSI